MAIEEGKAAPLFTLPDQDGKKVALKDLRGEHVLIFFYPKDDTPGCTKEACGFRDHHATLKGKGVTLLGISADGAESHRKFIEKYGLPFTLLSDAGNKVMEKYGAYGEKMMYGKPKIGVIRSSVLIDPAGKVVKHWRKVANAAKHPEQVLKILEAEGI